MLYLPSVDRSADEDCEVHNVLWVHIYNHGLLDVFKTLVSESQGNTQEYSSIYFTETYRRTYIFLYTHTLGTFAYFRNQAVLHLTTPKTCSC